MTLPDARRLAHKLMRQHGLIGNELGAPDWTFDFDRAVRRFGVCRFGDRKITISTKLTQLNSEARVTNTLLHEIAHALAGRGAGHGTQWRGIATSIGCDGARLYNSSEVVMPTSKMHRGTCPNCNRTVQRMRRMGIACGVCCKRFNGGKYSPEFKIRWLV